MRESFETTTESDRPVPREFSMNTGLERTVGFNNESERGIAFFLYQNTQASGDVRDLMRGWLWLRI